MKIRASVRKICEKCRLIHRRGRIQIVKCGKKLVIVNHQTKFKWIKTSNQFTIHA